MEKWLCVHSTNDAFKVGNLYSYSVRSTRNDEAWPWLEGDGVIYHTHPSKMMSAKFKPALEIYLQQL